MVLCSLCCIALLTTDGAIFHSKETGDRLLEVCHKIKIGILLEKLACNCTLLFPVYYVSLSLSNDQKNLSAQKKILVPSEISQHLWQMTDVDSCYLSGVWIISLMSEEAHAALILSPEL